MKKLEQNLISKEDNILGDSLVKRNPGTWTPAKQPQDSSPSIAWLYLGNQFSQKRVNQILAATEIVT